MSRPTDYPVILVVTSKNQPDEWNDISFWTTVDAAQAHKRRLKEDDPNELNSYEIYTRI